MSSMIKLFLWVKAHIDAMSWKARCVTLKASREGSER